MAYPRVDRSHIVPRAYLANFAVEGMLEMRLKGDPSPRPVSVRDAAVRTGFYARTRPDGSRIDDIEWSLSQLENTATPVLRELRDRWPLSAQDKAILAQLFGYQLIRGPRWKDSYEALTRGFVAKQRDAEWPTDDVASEVERLDKYLLSSTTRHTRMLGMGYKVASSLGSMHWALVEFKTPLLATSDHPVVPWPIADASRSPQPTPMNAGILETLEIRTPVSSWLAIVMTWIDDEDARQPIAGSRQHAANLNAFTVAQAETQWFYRPQSKPPVASGRLLALSPQLLRGYGQQAAHTSRRRAATSRIIQKRIGSGLEDQDVEIVVVSRNRERH